MSLHVKYENGNTREINRIVTHGGFFHADDVISTALVELLAIYEKYGARSIYDAARIRRAGNFWIYQEIQKVRGTSYNYRRRIISLPVPVYRTTTFEQDQKDRMFSENDLIFDVGFGEFDHHQKEARVHEGTNRKYCALTLLYDNLLDSNWFREIYNPELKTFERLLLDPIELGDTTGSNDNICIAVSSYNRNEESPRQLEENFLDAVLDFMPILNSWLLSMGDRSALYKKAADIADIRVNPITGEFFAVMEEQIQPSICSASIPQYVIAMTYPTNRGGWAVRSLDDLIDGSNVNRFLYPSELRGTTSEELGLMFCHPSGFYGTFTTKEKAIDFLNSIHFVRNQ